MSNTSYWLYQRYVKYGSQDWIPVYPIQYAISGDTGQDPVIKQENDPNCGYCPPEYRWYTPPIEEDYVCSGGNKYYKEVYQVSNDCGFNWENTSSARTGNLYESGSSDCIEYRWVNMDISTDWICDDCPDVEYRWTATTGYVCSGTNKMTKEIEQVSYDSGTTWQNVVPEVSRAALPVIEYDSTDCGYIPPSTYASQYFTTIPKSSGTFRLINTSSYYSTDSGSTWTLLYGNTDTPTFSTGQKVMWKSFNRGQMEYKVFSSTTSFDVEGNVMSLLYGDNFEGQTDLSGVTRVFARLFQDSGVVSAENLVLPATTLSDYCYEYMFYGCTNLTTAPSLPATTLANYCYQNMFQYCSNLTTAPQLPATTLANKCYKSMFYGCTKLTTAPMLSATTLVDACYQFMFSGCTLLNSVTCLATDISASNCTGYWVNGVSSTGTFTKASSMTGWTTGNNGIPSNWTVQNYSS